MSSVARYLVNTHAFVINQFWNYCFGFGTHLLVGLLTTLACQNVDQIFVMDMVNWNIHNSPPPSPLENGDGYAFSVELGDLALSSTSGWHRLPPKCWRSEHSTPGSHWCSPSPTCCRNHVPLPLSPSHSPPHSGNRVNPLGSTKCVWVRGEPTLKKEIPLYPPSPSPITNTQPPSPPPFVVLSCFPKLPSFSPPSPPLKFRVIIIACVKLNGTIYFSAHDSWHFGGGI